MATITTVDPTILHALGRLRRALSQLDPAFRSDLRTVAADPGRVGAAGLTAWVYAVDAAKPQRWVCPMTAVLLLRGQTTWPALASYTAADRFDALRDTPTWNDNGAAVSAYRQPRQVRHRGRLDQSRRGHGPLGYAAVAAKLQHLLGRLDDLDQHDPSWADDR